jgi:CubicO group peptidase (beta-lactamase class C family)
MRHGDQWMAWISDIENAVREKRLAAISLVFDSLLPKGYSRESFAGRNANVLDAKRIVELSGFIERAQRETGIPGLSLGLIQDGKTVFAGGFGVKELGRTGKPDADTLYLIASVTKPLTTLLLAKLVDEKRIAWDTPVTSVFPQFRLGDANTTRKVEIKHLICACTGLPRQDLEWLLEFKHATPASTLATLGTMQPTSEFGEMFQYSNLLAAAAGFVGGHAFLPSKELGEAYDEAMQSLVLDPLGMSSTTFDFKRALAANHAAAHALDIDGKRSPAVFDVNYAIVPVRPAGGAWSSVNDLLKYVAMELANGKRPDGSRYVSKEVLSARSVPNVWIGDELRYGMGLIISTKYGIRQVFHPGSMFGYRAQMLWWPDQGVGAVMLTNSDEGWTLTSAVERKLLELLFDGKPQAEDELRVAASAARERIASERKVLTLPPDRDVVARLADQYTNAALGNIVVHRTGQSVVFDFGEWKSAVASQKNPDGTTSFVTTVPGFAGQKFVAGEADGRRVLTLRDAQHEYVFREK